MANSIRIALIAASALALGACVTNEPKHGQASSASRGATSAGRARINHSPNTTLAR